MTTNPEVLRLARELMASSCESDVMRHSVLHGSYDDAREVRIAIAAIEKTTELNAEMLDRLRMHTCAKFTRSYNHLRQSEKDNSDAD